MKSATAAEEAIRFAVSYAVTTPFDVRGIVNATVQLQTYGANAQRVLPLVADLAAGMSQDIGYTSLVFGKAWSGSLEGFESLRNQLGITTQKLVKFGAVMNTEGGISIKTAADLDKARNALEKLVKTEYGGAIERQFKTYKGAVSNLEDAVSRLYVALGERLIPSLTVGAQELRKFIEVFEELPDSFKDLVVYSGASTLLFSGILSLVGMGGNALKMLKQNLDSMGIAWTRNGMIANATLQTMAANTRGLAQMSTISALGAGSPGAFGPALLFSGMKSGGVAVEETTRKLSAMQKVAAALKMELGTVGFRLTILFRYKKENSCKIVKFIFTPLSSY